MPELPTAKRERLIADYGLSPYDAKVSPVRSNWRLLRSAVAIAGRSNAKTCANWVMVDLPPASTRKTDEIGESPGLGRQLGGLVARIGDGTISTNIARKVFDALWSGEGSSADEIIARQDLQQISDSGSLETLIDELLAANPAMVAEFRAGKEKAFNAWSVRR
jgi:aspartyl-tRNA(Asn)/glutamyl-tRNA(Gln) amidotransferase subunit B